MVQDKLLYRHNGKLLTLEEAFVGIDPKAIVEIVQIDDAPEDYHTYHHPDCGTQHRGCHPTLCPKHVYETTGKWLGGTNEPN